MQLRVSQRWVSVVMSRRLGCSIMGIPFSFLLCVHLCSSVVAFNLIRLVARQVWNGECKAFPGV